MKKIFGEDFVIQFIGNIRSKSIALLREYFTKRLCNNQEFIKSTSLFTTQIIYLNFGNTSTDTSTCKLLINNTEAIKICIDKKLTFKALKGVCNIPEFTTSLDKAMKWEEQVVGRQFVKASGSKGIWFKEDNLEKFLKCKLFTKYIKKKAEYRVHVSYNKCFDVQQKKLKLKDSEGNDIDKSKVDWRVRNSKNGFVFARNNIEVPDCIIKESEKACKAVGINIAAVDVVLGIDNKPYILEINTAPGLTGTTVESYGKELLNVCNNLLEAQSGD